MMSAVELVQSELRRIHKMFEGALEGLTPDQLHAVPGGATKANTIAWQVWHCVRTEDNVVRFVLQDRRSPVWLEGGYADKLGLPPVAQGTGMSTEEAQALRIKDAPLFREYMGKVWASTDELFATRDAAFFDRTVTVKGLGEFKAIHALGFICVSHAMTHVGEIEITRTLLGAKTIGSH
jgi:DinB family protein